MIVFIDGEQLSGKSTLIDVLSKEYGFISNRFPFDLHVNHFKLNEKDLLNGFQIGKDLGILFALNAISPKNDFVFDRGPFSTIYYSLLDSRMTNEQILSFADEMSNYDFTYVFVRGINQHKSLSNRTKEDGFDNLKEMEISEGEGVCLLLEELANKYKLKYLTFYNDFSLSPEQNASNLVRLLKEIENEHTRSRS